MLIDSQMQTFKKLTSVAVQRAVEILSSDEGEFEYYRQDLQQDGIFLPNETQELIVRRIRRYKKIVEELKDKYQGRCQIENCGFTFTKRDGKHYAEAHHLVPLSEGGSQNPSNVLILCANHHRMFHYAVISIGELANGKRPIIINGTETNIVYE
jgi:predicted restriction endonuclease